MQRKNTKWKRRTNGIDSFNGRHRITGRGYQVQGQLIARNQKLESGVGATGVIGFIIGFVIVMVAVLVPPFVMG